MWIEKEELLSLTALGAAHNAVKLSRRVEENDRWRRIMGDILICLALDRKIIVSLSLYLSGAGAFAALRVGPLDDLIKRFPDRHP
jgi:hypothetical protein